MTSPFPGMDPYLESQTHWSGFHHLLADEIMAQLNAILSDKYYAELEIKTSLEEVGISRTHLIYPDVAVLEVEPSETAPSKSGGTVLPAPVQRVALPETHRRLRTIQVYLTDDKTLVTTLEILSPANKFGQGRLQYRQKRERILHSHVHLVELDFLRAGQRPGWEVIDPPLETDYVCLVNRADDSPARLSEIWPIALNEPLPMLPIPLLIPDPDIILNLGEVMPQIYRRAAYARRIDYSQPVPPPKLRPEIAAWLRQRT